MQKGRHYLQNFALMAKPKWKPAKMELIPKRLFSAMMQLKVGHGFFKSYLVRLPDYPHNRCFIDCNLIQSPEHLLLVCKHYREERIEFKKSIGNENFTYPLLYASSKNQRALIEFIRQTGISTRGWLLNHQLIDWLIDHYKMISCTTFAQLLHSLCTIFLYICLMQIPYVF